MVSRYSIFEIPSREIQVLAPKRVAFSPQELPDGICWVVCHLELWVRQALRSEAAVLGVLGLVA